MANPPKSLELYSNPVIGGLTDFSKHRISNSRSNTIHYYIPRTENKMLRLFPLLVSLQCLVSSQPLDGVLDGLQALLLDRPVPATTTPVPMQVIGAGLPRTDTGSLHRALTMLGYHT